MSHSPRPPLELPLDQHLHPPLLRSGPLTGMALSSINKFLLYGFVDSTVPRAREAVNLIAFASTNCRFESSSQADDEVRVMPRAS